ncbi:MAG: DinB family protein [Chloroflexota bacterium]
MTHPLVLQYQFAREKWFELLADMPAEHAARRFGRMNSISWTVAHLGHVEQRAFIEMLGQPRVTEIYQQYDIYKPNVVPPYDEVMAAWKLVMVTTDPLLEALTEEDMHRSLLAGGENIGTWLQRLTGHLWYHNGEASAVRQLIDDRDLPQMVGSIPVWAAFGTTVERV